MRDVMRVADPDVRPVDKVVARAAAPAARPVDLHEGRGRQAASFVVLGAAEVRVVAAEPVLAAGRERVEHD
jgi:hypothetical protein